MTAVTADLEYDRRIPFGRIWDTWAVTQRDLIHFIRIPQLLIFSTIQPVIFVLFHGMYQSGLPSRGSVRGLPDARHLRADGGVTRRRSAWLPT